MPEAPTVDQLPAARNSKLQVVAIHASAALPSFSSDAAIVDFQPISHAVRH